MRRLTKYAAILIVFLTACEVEHTIPVQPEVTHVEKTTSPFEHGIWIENEYRWDGNTYVIVPAHWTRSKGTWVPGHWKSTPKGYTWIRGHWK
jgi:hypothetical protein